MCVFLDTASRGVASHFLYSDHYAFSSHGFPTNYHGTSNRRLASAVADYICVFRILSIAHCCFGTHIELTFTARITLLTRYVAALHDGVHLSWSYPHLAFYLTLHLWPQPLTIVAHLARLRGFL